MMHRVKRKFMTWHEENGLTVTVLVMGGLVLCFVFVCFAWSEENAWNSDTDLLFTRPYALASYLSIMGVEGISQSHWFVEAAHRLALSWARHVPEKKRLEYDMVLLVTDPYNLLNTRAMASLREVGWILIKVDPLYGIPSDPSYMLQNHYTHTAQFTKLHLWTFEQYQHVLYLDSDMLIMKDVLSAISRFNPSADTLVVARDVGDKDYFNAGLLYITPSRKEFDLMRKASSYMNYDPSLQEQAFLNVYWENRTVFMPKELNEVVGGRPTEGVVVLHFIGRLKPWFICPYFIEHKEACDVWHSYDEPAI